MHSQMLLLTSEIEKYKETTGKSVAELDNLMMKSNTLEVFYLVFLGALSCIIHLVQYFLTFHLICLGNLCFTKGAVA